MTPTFRFLALATFAITLAACGGGDEEDSRSSSGGTSSSNSSSSSDSTAALTNCKNAPYDGDQSDPQVYVFDAIAQFDICAYKATGNNDYLTDGNRQCRVLAGLIADTRSTFRPLYCSGSSLRI